MTLFRTRRYRVGGAPPKAAGRVANRSPAAYRAYRRLVLATLLLLYLVGALYQPIPALASGAIVRPLPEYSEIAVGQEKEIEIVVEDVEDLYGLDIRTRFDPAILEVVDADPDREGTQVAAGQFPHPDFAVKQEADNDAGTIWYVVTQLNPRQPASGSGTAFTIRFRTKGTGSSVIDIESVDLVDRNGRSIEAERAGGEIVVVASDGATLVPSPPTPTRTETPMPTSQPSPTPQGEGTIPTSPTQTPQLTEEPTPQPTATDVPPTGEPGAQPTRTAVSSTEGPTARPTETPAPPTSTPALAGGYPSPSATRLRKTQTRVPTKALSPNPPPVRTESTQLPEPTRPLAGHTQPATRSSQPQVEPTRETGKATETLQIQPEAGAGAQPPTPSPARVAAVIPTAKSIPTLSATRKETKPLIPQEIFICLAVLLVLFTAALMAYLLRRQKKGARSIGS